MISRDIMDITRAIDSLKDEIKNNGIVPERGLGTELFLFLSTLTPIINVDILVTDRNNRVLLAWRDDVHAGRGWHIPGSCIRFRETFEQSIERCAREELGTEVQFYREPIKCYEFHSDTLRKGLDDQNERAHFVTLVFACKVQKDYRINNEGRLNNEAGYLKWFDTIPEDILPVHRCYQQDWGMLISKINRISDYY